MITHPKPAIVCSAPLPQGFAFFGTSNVLHMPLARKNTPQGNFFIEFVEMEKGQKIMRKGTLKKWRIC